jgi:hypothetical protein
MSRRTDTNAAARTTVSTPREDGEVQREQAERDRGAHHLDREHRCRDPVVPRRHLHGLHVDHVVERLDVEARGAGGRRGRERVARDAPQRSLQPVTVRDRLVGGRAAGDGVRESYGRVGVTNEVIERSRPHGLAERLRAQVRRADRVGLLDDGCAAGVVAPDGHGEAEGQDQRDETQQRGLQDAERLAQGVRVRAQPTPSRHPAERRAEHDAVDEQPELEAPQPVERHVRPR